MFECKVRIMPLMGRSVCEVTTAQGVHTAIAPTHKESFQAGMTMAKIALNHAVKESGKPDPECKARRGEVPNGPRHH